MPSGADESSLRLLGAIVQSSDAAIYSLDLKGTITSWNTAAERLFGYPAAEAVGHPISIIVPADREREEVDVLQRITAGESIEHYETLRRRKNGSIFNASITVSPIRSSTGVIIGASKFARDITQEKQLERDARQLAAIVMSSDDAIVSKDLNGIIKSWNGAAERLLGYTSDEMVGRSIRIIIPDDRQGEEDEVLRRIRRGEAIEHFDTVRRRKDGRALSVSLTVSPIRSASGEIIGASKILRDVTEAKQAARRSTFLAEAGAVMAGSLDYEATLSTVVNLTVPTVADWCAADIMGSSGRLERLAVAHVDPDKVEIARLIRERYDDPSAPASPASVAETRAPVLLSLVTEEMIHSAMQGDVERMELIRSLGLTSYICVPLIAHGRVLGALTLATAESRRVYTEEDLRFAQDLAYRAAVAIDNAQAYREMHVANRLKDDFLATLSHELRTPLNAILGYARMLRTGAMTPDRQQRAIDTVERNATTLAQIVEDVLDVSRIVSGKVRLSIQPLDLPPLVRNAVETIMPAAEAKQIRVHTVVDPRAAPVSGDPDRIQQIVWNLVSNAVKFTPKGGQVQVRVERVNSHVEIVVSDTGIGIRAEFLPHMFERFRQADSSTTREHGGLGLGLAIVRHLVELHGGSVHATSAGEGKGATFCVRLPVMIVHPEIGREDRRREHPVGHRPGPASSLLDLDRIHVLAVDDDTDALNLVREILETAGAQVTTADSAVQALDRLPSLRPDVLVADIGLPIMDGYELIKQIRSLPDSTLRRVPAAALTAYARAEDRVRSLQNGFQMHLAKPIDPAELVAAVRALASRTVTE